MPELPVTGAASAIDRIPAPARRAAVVVLRLVIAGVFLGAALPKLVDPASFAEDIDNYRMVPDALVGPMALALPIVEAVIALALITGVHAAGAALLSGALLLSFAVAMAQAMARGIDLDCGCFGEVSEMRVSGLTVARNLLLAIACVPIVLARRPGARVRPPEPAPEPPAAG